MHTREVPPDHSPESANTLGAAGLLIPGAAAAFGLVRFAPEASATCGPQSYMASRFSVDQHPSTPEWFQDGRPQQYIAGLGVAGVAPDVEQTGQHQKWT